MEKFFLQSKTIIGVLMMLITNLGPLIGISFGADDASMVNGAIDQIITGIGGVIAVWGRATANSTIKLF